MNRYKVLVLNNKDRVWLVKGSDSLETNNYRLETSLSYKQRPTIAKLRQLWQAFASNHMKLIQYHGVGAWYIKVIDTTKAPEFDSNIIMFYAVTELF